MVAENYYIFNAAKEEHEKNTLRCNNLPSMLKIGMNSFVVKARILLILL
jgi:hypothetical protein